MTRIPLRRLVLFAAAILWAPQAAFCQYPGGYAPPRPYNPYTDRPTVSPYTNLLRGGNPALTYHGLIAPQLEAERFRAQQTRSLQQLQGSVQSLRQQGPGTTGHSAYFFNYSHFYRFPGARQRTFVGQ